MENGKYRALFLDMDGTFLDFGAAEHNAFYKAFRKAGQEPDEERYRLYSAINDSLWKAFERGEIEKAMIRSSRYTKLFEALGVKADGMAAEQDYERLLGEEAALMPQAKEVLAYLAKKYELYVVTNGFAQVQRNRLRLSGIERYMRQVFISEEIGYQKPQKEFFDSCFARIEPALDPKEVLLIGDSLTSDISGAKNAGMDSCWFHPTDSINPGSVVPEYEIHSLAELYTLL